MGVPNSLLRKEALDYAREHLADIPLEVLEYVADSEQLDEEYCDFAEQKGRENKMEIKELVYELYKGDWKINHGIFRQQEVNALKEYYKQCQETESSCTFEEWLEEFGYCGELFVCKGEFLTNEYLDKSYVRRLLNSNDLFQQYLKVMSMG